MQVSIVFTLVSLTFFALLTLLRNTYCKMNKHTVINFNFKFLGYLL